MRRQRRPRVTETIEYKTLVQIDPNEFANSGPGHACPLGDRRAWHRQLAEGQKCVRGIAFNVDSDVTELVL